jgi:predicted lipoprotein with Yx(FWY)xxD motif
MRKALVILPLTLLVAGCGATSAGQPASSATTAAKHATVTTRHGKLGTFLVDGSGRTLYLFKKDTGPTSRCTGACATDWPPTTSREKPEAEGKAKASMLSRHKRAGGAKQVTYNGHPLYRFFQDTKAGQTNGEGLNAFGAHWYVVSPAGKAIKPTAAAGAPAPPSPYPSY